MKRQKIWPNQIMKINLQKLTINKRQSMNYLTENLK